jgi:hypothetical protein
MKTLKREEIYANRYRVAESGHVRALSVYLPCTRFGGSKVLRGFAVL